MLIVIFMKPCRAKSQRSKRCESVEFWEDDTANLLPPLGFDVRNMSIPRKKTLNFGQKEQFSSRRRFVVKGHKIFC